MKIQSDPLTAADTKETALTATLVTNPSIIEPEPGGAIARWALLTRFRQLRDELNEEILEAHERIDGALIALVAGMHMAMVGAPGVAKTYLVDRMMLRISGANYYAEVMKKLMPMEEVVGPVSITALKNDQWHRITTGMLPEADVALIDEFTRTSDAILTSTLEILNERRYKNGAVKGPVPLSSAFLCSNSFPTGEADHDLEAFWDRVVMRFEVDLPADEATWKAIARMRHPEFPAVVLSWADVLEAKAQAAALPITDEAFEAIDEIRRDLADVGITMSPRRCRQAQFVAAAWAWLEGADQVLPEHCIPLQHMLWDVPEQQAQVMRSVVGIVAPGQKAAIDLADGVQELIDAIEGVLATDPSEWGGQLNELHTKVRGQKVAIDAFKGDATGKALLTVEAADKQLRAITLRLMKDGFQVDFADVEGLSG